MQVTAKDLTVDTAIAVFRKSSFSGSNTDVCVEVASIDGGFAVRDSKDPDGAVLLFNRGERAAFRSGVAAGEFLE